MEVSHLLKLVSEIPQNSRLQYVRSQEECEFVNVDLTAKRIYSIAPNGDAKSWAPTYLADLAPKIFENEPFNLSGILNNKGSYRPVLETIIAHTREFYTVRKGSATFLVWIPSMPKLSLDLEEIQTSEIPLPVPHGEYIPKINEIIYNPTIDKQYTVEELGRILREINATIAEGSRTSMFTLFGLKYGKHIDKATQILAAAGLPTNTHANSISTGKQLYDFILERKLDMAFWNPKLSIFPLIKQPIKSQSTTFTSYLAAMRTKPFLLFAGISGTGKSRIVKEMAFASCPPDLRQDKVTPGNYCMIEVKPNWHDSTELIGYESKINGDHYVVTPFINFLLKAIHNPQVPFFVCLDEMNLAPVEQYFAEFLSVLESRKLINGEILSEPLIKAEVFSKKENFNSFKKAYFGNNLAAGAFVPEESADLWMELGEKGLRLPPNLIVIGTVNMDETTYQFSRKVIDRAMTIEMNEVNFESLFEPKEDTLQYRDPYLGAEYFLPKYAAAKDAFTALNETDRGHLKANIPLALKSIDEKLASTPFRIAYRVENELILYFAALREEQPEADAASLLTAAVDDILMMKVLPRIEGNEDMLTGPLDGLRRLTNDTYPKAHAKVAEMQKRLEANHFTSFWP